EAVAALGRGEDLGARDPGRGEAAQHGLDVRALLETAVGEEQGDDAVLLVPGRADVDDVSAAVARGLDDVGGDGDAQHLAARERRRARERPEDALPPRGAVLLGAD